MPEHPGAADAFEPLSGLYTGAIEPGAFVEYAERNGNRHGSLGLRLDIGKGEQRVVRAGFLLKSPTAIGAERRDAEILAKWARLVDAAPPRDWFDIVRNLWIGQRRLDLALTFDIRPAPNGRGYLVLDVKSAGRR